MTAKYIIKSSDSYEYLNLDMKIWKTELTFTIFISIIVIYILYHMNIIKKIPCSSSFVNIFIRNFIHINTVHLLSNLAGLIILYKIESSLGSNKFLFIFSSILLVNTIIEWLLYKYVKDMKCSIGLSGILFGFIVFELMNLSQCKFTALLALVGALLLPSLKDSNVSIIGHLTGVFAGVIVGGIYKCVIL